MRRKEDRPCPVYQWLRAQTQWLPLRARQLQALVRQLLWARSVGPAHLAPGPALLRISMPTEGELTIDPQRIAQRSGPAIEAPALRSFGTVRLRADEQEDNRHDDTEEQYSKPRPCPFAELLIHESEIKTYLGHVALVAA